ncbi:mitochondrial carrier [Fistulina hepatica ATCC 64428]|nr:mitochondrial carrier [Fistulina hepatica ATCC 64428]
MRTLEEFRRTEGRDERKRRLKEVFSQLPHHDPTPPHGPTASVSGSNLGDQLTPEQARRLKEMYEDELLGSCGGGRIGWAAFRDYAYAKEQELWDIFHNELDLDGNGHLDVRELNHALAKAGIHLESDTLNEFVDFLTASPHSQSISFTEFRDFLLLLPRKISAEEIYTYYRLRKFMGDDGRGAARVNMEGDVSLSAEDKPPEHKIRPTHGGRATQEVEDGHEDVYEEDEDEVYAHNVIGGKTAAKFLLAGGIAGAVSRTCTAPFDRLKVFLITRPPNLGGAPAASAGGLRVLAFAVRRIYAEGGLTGFWTGNGLSVMKIFPESAIKFFVYESTKRQFARYWDHVEDPRDISQVSRFLSGGIGGISAQLSIYPIETLKTQMMSSAGGQKRTLFQAAKYVWSLGGVRAYYRGLTIGLVGVFPYAAIDMSTFEALKLAYVRSTGQAEPGVLALLSFGSISGSVGATSVFPLNLVRTRLQASGSSGHPQRYTGLRDVIGKTWERDGWRGFYRGLFPTLAKVVPAVSISYVVYEQSKRRLGV